MNTRHYILKEIYTYDIDYWNSILEKDFICQNDMIGNKLFINDSSIDEISITDFINLTSDYCTIIDNRPQDPFCSIDRYKIIKNCIQKPGFTYIREPFNPLNELRVNSFYPAKSENTNIKRLEPFLVDFTRELMQGFEFIFNKKIPDEIRNSFINIRYKLALSSPGRDNYLAINREFLETLTKSISIIYPNFDMNKITEEIYSDALFKHKEALKNQIKDLNKLLKKRLKKNNTHEVILTEEKINEITEELKYLNCC